MTEPTEFSTSENELLPTGQPPVRSLKELVDRVTGRTLDVMHPPRRCWHRGCGALSIPGFSWATGNENGPVALID